MEEASWSSTLAVPSIVEAVDAKGRGKGEGEWEMEEEKRALLLAWKGGAVTRGSEGDGWWQRVVVRVRVRVSD